MKTMRLVLALCTVLSCLSVSAQMAQSDSLLPEFVQQNASIRSTRIFFDGDASRPSPSQDSIGRLINQFYLDQFRHSQDPQIPYFLFMSKDASLAMGIGGVVKMRVWEDWGGYLPSNGFSIYNIAIPPDPGKMRRLGFTPGGSSLFFTIIGRSKVFSQYTGYIEGDFGGYNNVGFRLKKAYFSFRDWTVGLAPSTFSDPSAEPPVLDGSGPGSEMSRKNVLVRYMHTSRKGFSFGGSVEFSKSDANAGDDGSAETVPDYLPDLAALLQYQWNSGKSHVRLSGLLRGIPYRDLTAMRNHTILGWGLQLSAVAKIVRPLTMYGILSYGRGHASYSGDLSEGSYDLVPVPGQPGRLYAPRMFGFTWGATYYFRPHLYMTVALGELRYLPVDNPHDSEYKYGLYGACNLVWEITSRIRCGLEYLAGKRVDFNLQHGNVNRVNALFRLSF